MVQLWVNLPAKDKMSTPGYQTILSTDIPTVELPDAAGNLRVIAGDYDGNKGPARTFTPIDVWDVRLNAGRSVEFDVPEAVHSRWWSCVAMSRSTEAKSLTRHRWCCWTVPTAK
jgi:redox-sensitive bicupin YhaK (pirin superfamily)